MQSILNFLIWSPDPEIFVIPGIDHPVVWYGLLFAGGFILSQQVMFWIFKKEGRPEKDVEKLTLYMVVATVIGARLGHCLFYNPGFYLSNPIEILKIWEGGLASHGGAIGIIIAIYLFGKKYPQYPMLWMLDRLVIVVALTGAMIRTGNFVNSEMEGVETHSSTGVVYARYTKEVLEYDEEKIDKVTFEKGGEAESSVPGRYPITAKVTYKRGVKPTESDKRLVENQIQHALKSYDEVTQHVDFGQKSEPLAYKFYEEDGRAVLAVYGIGIVRHAAQLYEAAYCVLIMIVLFWCWKEKRFTLPSGFNFALFMIVLWSLRFVDEFFKMNQEAFEENLALNMGQILSIPLTIAGVIMMIYFFMKQKKAMSGEERKLA